MHQIKSFIIMLRIVAAQSLCESHSMVPCKRHGCPHTRLYGAVRRHGYCCYACLRSAPYHTPNCTGSLLPESDTDPSDSGPESESAAAATRPVTIDIDPVPFIRSGFQIPDHWTCAGRDNHHFLNHIWWYLRRYDFTPSNDVTIA